MLSAVRAVRILAVLESEAVRPLGRVLQDLSSSLTSKFPEGRVEWDQSWSRQRGRLRIRFKSRLSPVTIANALLKLIDQTKTILDQAIEKKLSKGTVKILDGR